MDRIKIVMVAVGGFASYFWDTIHEKIPSSEFEIVAVVDPFRKQAACYEDIKKRGIPEFDTVDEFFAAGVEAELAVVLSPHHHHKQQTITCLEHGLHVLCEKPAAPLVSDLDEMIAVAEKANRILGIGFQWSFLPEIMAMKKDIMNKRFGEVLHGKTIVCWTRNTPYYSNDWRGMIKNEAGEYVLDSLLANTTSHYLHNLLFLCGDEWNRAAEVGELKVAAYRAKRIQNFDSISLEADIGNGRKMTYLSSVAVDDWLDPLFEIQCEEGKFGVDRNSEDQRFYAEDKNGNREYYGEKPDNDLLNVIKLIEILKAVREFKQTGKVPAIVCDGYTSRPHLVVMNRVAFGAPIHDFPEEVVVEYDNEDYQGRFVPELTQEMFKCYRHSELLSASTLPGIVPEADVPKLADLKIPK